MTKSQRIEALTQYGQIILQHGWAAGEPFIARQELLHPGCSFKQWATALAIALRTQEILDGNDGIIGGPWTSESTRST